MREKSASRRVCQLGGATMNVRRKAAEPLTVPEEPDKAEQVYKAAASQEASLAFSLDEALLEASLAGGGLAHSRSARRQETKPMYCYACHEQTGERCSYCLLPVCPEHAGPVQPWFTRRQVLVCTPCQAKLMAIAKEEERLSFLYSPVGSSIFSR